MPPDPVLELLSCLPPEPAHADIADLTGEFGVAEVSSGLAGIRRRFGGQCLVFDTKRSRVSVVEAVWPQVKGDCRRYWLERNATLRTS